MYNYIVNLTLKAHTELLQMSLSKIFLFFCFSSACWVTLHAFLSSVDFFFKLTFCKNIKQKNIQECHQSVKLFVKIISRLQVTTSMERREGKVLVFHVNLLPNKPYCCLIYLHTLLNPFMPNGFF